MRIVFATDKIIWKSVKNFSVKVKNNARARVFICIETEMVTDREFISLWNLFFSSLSHSLKFILVRFGWSLMCLSIIILYCSCLYAVISLFVRFVAEKPLNDPSSYTMLCTLKYYGITVTWCQSGRDVLDSLQPYSFFFSFSLASTILHPDSRPSTKTNKCKREINEYLEWLHINLTMICHKLFWGMVSIVPYVDGIFVCAGLFFCHGSLVSTFTDFWSLSISFNFKIYAFNF